MLTKSQANYVVFTGTTEKYISKEISVIPAIQHLVTKVNTREKAQRTNWSQNIQTLILTRNTICPKSPNSFC